MLSAAYYFTIPKLKKYILKYLFFNIPVVFLSMNISQHDVNFKLLAYYSMIRPYAPIGLEGKKEIYVYCYLLIYLSDCNINMCCIVHTVLNHMFIHCFIHTPGPTLRSWIVAENLQRVHILEN